MHPSSCSPLPPARARAHSSSDSATGAPRGPDLVRRRGNSDRVVMVEFGAEQAAPGVSSYDRRVVMFTSAKSIPAVVAEELAKTRARSVAWSDHGHLTVQLGPSMDVGKR